MCRILTAGRVDGSLGSSVAADAHTALNPVNPVANWVMYVCLHVCVLDLLEVPQNWRRF